MKPLSRCMPACVHRRRFIRPPLPLPSTLAVACGCYVPVRPTDFELRTVESEIGSVSRLGLLGLRLAVGVPKKTERPDDQHGTERSQDHPTTPRQRLLQHLRRVAHAPSHAHPYRPIVWSGGRGKEE
jgi:hypothetical protein